MTLHRNDTDIWTVSDALTQEECTEFMEHGEATGFEAATVAFRTGAQMRTDLRNNDCATVDDETLAAILWERMKPFTPAEIVGFPAIALKARFRFYRYEPG